jgi:hypothetical protein
MLSGGLAYIGHLGVSPGDLLVTVGQSALSADGSIVVFRSNDPGLNAIGGQQNGGAFQYYRYDDKDRSLVCVSCPVDGSTSGGVEPSIGGLGGLGANVNPISADGEVFAFTTTTPLVRADQNTAGPGQPALAGSDVYEWRAGRLLLITDGLTNWASYFAAGGFEGGEIPKVRGVTPSGNDIFFTAAAQLTQDALDGYSRLYDARIGGGFEFPSPPKPCPLEVCQGTPKGAPEEQAPGTATITGVGNLTRTAPRACPKGKRRAQRGGKARCVKPKQRKQAPKRRANDNRRAAR